MTMNPMNRDPKRRIRIAELLCIVLCVAIAGIFSMKYLIFPWLRPASRAERNDILYQAVNSYGTEGTYTDRNGNIIMAGGTSEEPLNFDYAYLLGYYTVNSGRENSYGLRGNLKSWTLFHLDSSDIGASVQLTTDNDLMDYCTQVLGNNEGSITVIDNKTGAILALASNSLASYDVNDPSTLFNSDVPEAQYRRGTFETDPPGSTFKIVTSAAALTKEENDGNTDDFFTYDDTGSYTPAGSDYAIHNAEDAVYGTIGLQDAFVNSVNCYFADIGVRTGADQLKKTASDFMVGKDIDIPFLDTLHSQYDLEDESPLIIAQTSYGQGNTQITPVHIALISEAIANNGVMMAPYIVKSVHSENLPLYQHFDHKLSTCTDEETASTIKDIMHAAAVDYGMDEADYGMCYAKTGTAECAGDRIHSYITGFTDSYSYCISLNNSYYGTSLPHQMAAQLSSYLYQMG